MKVFTDDPRYVRDMNSNAILAKDFKNLQKHRMKLKQINDLKTDTKEINNLKIEIAELKNMMSIILEKLSKEKDGSV